MHGDECVLETKRPRHSNAKGNVSTRFAIAGR